MNPLAVLTVLRTIAAVAAAAGLACANAPTSAPTPLIAPGVTVSGVRIGGLSAEPARTRIEHAFSRAVTIAAPGRTVRISPQRVGARSSIEAAVTSALTATPRSSLRLPVRFSQARIASIVASLARRYDRAPVSARVTGADAAGPTFSPARPGRAVERATMRTAIARALRGSGTRRLVLATRPVVAARTVANYGPIIVISRGANRLTLYRGATAVRTFPVATGQAIYPTPAGLWHIMDKQLDPWWYPPTYDSWAKGLKPVPPGPSNPLGTRWMGLNAPGVGIHGTDAPTSIGYSASHGCVRMQVPDAEWLFERVAVGTPVVIL